jgi:hypothetical protein
MKAERAGSGAMSQTNAPTIGPPPSPPEPRLRRAFSWRLFRRLRLGRGQRATENLVLAAVVFDEICDLQCRDKPHRCYRDARCKHLMPERQMINPRRVAPPVDHPLRVIDDALWVQRVLVLITVVLDEPPAMTKIVSKDQESNKTYPRNFWRLEIWLRAPMQNRQLAKLQ